MGSAAGAVGWFYDDDDGAAQSAYSFSVRHSPFSFAVRRRSTNETLFDSAGLQLYFSPLCQLRFCLAFWTYVLQFRRTDCAISVRAANVYNNDNGRRQSLWTSADEDERNAHLVMLWNSDVIDLIVFFGLKPLDLIQQYTDVAGKPLMPSLWSIGYHQCHDGYRTANYSLQVAMNYTLNALPLDIMWSDINGALSRIHIRGTVRPQQI